MTKTTTQEKAMYNKGHRGKNKNSRPIQVHVTYACSLSPSECVQRR